MVERDMLKKIIRGGADTGNSLHFGTLYRKD